MSSETIPSFTLQDLPEARRKTEIISKLLADQISGHLETTRPIFSPDRIFGKYAGGKSDVLGSESALTELRDLFKQFNRKPFELPETLDTNWLSLVGGVLELQPYQYPHLIENKPINITSPFKWILTYRNNCSALEAGNMLAGKEVLRANDLRQFVVNNLVLQVLLKRQPGITRLFSDLNFLLKIETTPDLLGLPVYTISSCIKTFRPTDDVIKVATAFSGISAFIELIDLDSLEKPTDHFKEKIIKLLS